VIEESEIYSRTKNESLITFYENFSKLTGLSIRFERLKRRLRAQNQYTDYSNEFIIRLRKDWKEVDVAHELIHGKIMFIDKYGIVMPYNDLCKLIRVYMEDVIVHENIFKEFVIMPFDELFVSFISKLAKALVKGHVIVDSHWDSKGLVCNRLHKAFLYVQVWHFNQLMRRSEFEEFLTAFRRSYRGLKEIELTDEIIEIIENNKNLNNQENYDHALKKITEMEYLDLKKENLIKHYEKKDVGYALLARYVSN